MNCCEIHKVDCNQGRLCPSRLRNHDGGEHVEHGESVYILPTPEDCETASLVISLVLVAALLIVLGVWSYFTLWPVVVFALL